MNNHHLITILLLPLVLFLLPLIAGVSFDQPITINTGLPVFTNDNIVCAWNYSADTTEQNISLYQDGALFYNDYQSGTLDTSVVIDSSNTAKNEIWVCNITLYNGTGQTSAAENATIQNSAPETPTVSDIAEIDIGTEDNITEDSIYTYSVNSSDPDGDDLTYYFKASTQAFCSMTATPGVAQCAPTQAYLDNNSLTPVNVTFWVDDDDLLKAKSASLKVTFWVTPRNDPPVLSLTDQQITINESLVYDFTATDEEDDVPMNFTLSDVPTEIAPKLTLETNGDYAASIVYNASPPDYNDINESGWLIVVNVTDANNASSFASFLLNISNSGRPPYMINTTPTGPYNLLQGEFLQVNMTVGDYDDEDSLTFFTNDTRVNIVKTRDLSTSTNATAEINFTPGDDAVGSYDVLVTIQDLQLLTNSTVLTFNVTNVNDAPFIYEMSYAGSNTAGENISNLSAFGDAIFIYYVNATDYDLDDGDSLTYYDNATGFNINPTTGLIDWTPSGAEDSEDVNITVVDSFGLNFSRILTYSIVNNTAPYFNDTLPDMNCSEKYTCSLNLSHYTKDDDVGDSIQSYDYQFLGASLGTFSINSEGYINFIPQQTEIGDYLLNITITDTRGASSWGVLNISVNNSEDTPTFTRWDFSGSTIVAGHQFTYQLQADDDDLLLGSRTLNFTTNTSFLNLTFQYYALDTAYALIAFTPGSGQVGTWSVELNVTDETGRYDREVFSITILPDSAPPNILEIKPYGNNSDAYALVNDWISTSDPQFSGGDVAQIVLSENQTYLFEHHTTDDLTPNASLTTYWYYDGVLNHTGYTFPLALGFHEEGARTVQLIVEDSYLENSTWNWSLDVEDVNRKPVLTTDLDSPLVLNQTMTISNYFTQTNTNTHFIDPDDETVNENGQWESGENNTLDFFATNCDYATITISGSDLTIAPLEEGSCVVLFTAMDSEGESLQSNPVTINVSIDSQGEVQTVSQNNPSTGGGASSRRNSYIPLMREEHVPDPINILTPNVVTIYENNTISIPIEVKNTWTDDINYIKLSAETNRTAVTMHFLSDLIEVLEPNESFRTELIVENYRLGENFEVKVVADVQDPPFTDSAVVLLATIEHSSPGSTTRDAVNVKVTFARDLFNDNPECGELNELLNEARKSLANGDIDGARLQVDAAINGCKYLVSTLQQQEEEAGLVPNTFTLDDVTLSMLMWASLAFIALLTIAFIIYYNFTGRDEDEI